MIHRIKHSRAAVVSATITHILAWAAFLWLALWPYAYQEISATAVSVDGSGVTTKEEVRHSASITEVNGYWVLLPLFVPVLVTAFGSAVTVNLEGRVGRQYFDTWGLGDSSSNLLRPGASVPWSVIRASGHRINSDCYRLRLQTRLAQIE